jgi:uncharacterized protein YecE (DUF72 family)
MLIGTAGWNIPRASAHRFSAAGTHLERYARVFGCTEINSSFHRPHARATYARWAEATPQKFRFAVKMPRAITHDARLLRPDAALERFLEETSGLGEKRGPILVQLPPSVDFDARVAGRFFRSIRARYDGPLVCEPRHATWAARAADDLLVRYRVARVAADPPRTPTFANPGGWNGILYFRLHGSPRTYWSSYSSPYLDTLASYLRVAEQVTAWCVFDNTATGAAIENAWELQSKLVDRPASPS